MSLGQAKSQSERSIFRLERSKVGWGENLATLAGDHPLQSWSWGSFKERWGWEAFPLLLSISEPSSGMPSPAAAMVLKRKLPWFPFSILYVPKGPLLDFKNPPLRRVVLAQLEGFARQEKAIFIKIDPDVISGWGVDEDRPSPIGAKFKEELVARGWRFSQDQIQFRNTVLLDLEREEADILASFKQKTRYNIRLAGRRDVTVRYGSDVDLPLIAEMYQETAVRDGFTIRPAEYYLDVWRTFYEDGMAQPFIAEYEGVPLAAVIIIFSKRQAIYMYGASTDLERKRMPNHLLQWEAIRWARNQGCTTYDFWGAPNEFVESDPLWGVWRFKRGFNGQVVKHIGAWDYPVKPFWYWLYTTVIPRYLDLLRSRGNN
jgi:lipid II:glycine glycyltransferase (peptidoglycan interpeptide bridge formation enzyme)